MTFLTIKRIRQLRKIIGLVFIIIGVTFLAFPTFLIADWFPQHLMASASSCVFIIAAIAVLFFAAPADLESVLQLASIAGYTPSEEKKKLAGDRIRVQGKLYLFFVPVYTLLWWLHIYFVVEPTNILAIEEVAVWYMLLTWSMPVLFISVLGIPYYIYKKFFETDILMGKVIEGSLLLEKKKKLRKKGLEDYKIMNEDNEKKKKSGAGSS